MFDWLARFRNRWFRRTASFDGPRVAFLGDGFSGSWQMRAEQIAATRPGWRAMATKELRPADLAKFDLFCIVKRFDVAKVEWIRSHGKPVVYDVIDPWKQPDDGEAHPTLDEAIRFFRGMLAGLPVDGVIFPNAAMHADLGRYVPAPTHIYHHHRPHQQPIIVRREAKRVGYEGREDYLGSWHETAARVCRGLGLEFVVNPKSLADLDIGLAVRGGRHGTLIPKRYKSNVKLANLFAAGLPAVAHADELSYRETDDGQVQFFRDAASLETALRELLPYERRLAVHKSHLAQSRRFTIDAIAEQHEHYFRSLLATRTERERSQAAIVAA